MYGVIGSTVVIGAIVIQIIKRLQIKDIKGAPIKFENKNMGIVRYLCGGILFGLGWALSGACPGPMFTLVGAGFSVFTVVILSAILGTYVYAY
jgi:uncharacterized membrane protein YedE/YeeE